MAYGDWDKRVDFSDLLGKTLVRAERVNDGCDDKMIFVTDEGVTYEQYHPQSCCENVEVEDICGDLADLIGSPLLMAEEVTNQGEANYVDGDYDKKAVRGWPEGIPVPDYVSDSFTWSFYKLATIKGSVTIRWFGSSNGYYGETVDLYRL